MKPTCTLFVLLYVIIKNYRVILGKVYWTMELLLAAVAAVAAAVATAKAMERQQKEQSERQAKIPIPVEEPKIERRRRD